MGNLHRKQTAFCDTTSHIIYFFFFFSISIYNVTGAGESPFTPKAQVLRYWSRETSAVAEPPEFLLKKLSPLSAIDAAVFSKLAAANSLSTKLPSFCSAAKLLCFSDLADSDKNRANDRSSSFSGYLDRNFTNYGSEAAGGEQSFVNYSPGENIPVNTFRRYGRNSAGHGEKFNNYGTEGNVVDQRFNTYGAGAAGGSGEFTKYASNVNVPNLRFTSYSDQTTGRKQSFKSYSENANAGDQSFANYAKNGNGGENEFKGYATSSNVVGSGFSSYQQSSNGGGDKFTSYAFDTNNPKNSFRSYGDGGNSIEETFTSYREKANVGDDSFQSYAKGSTGDSKVEFSNYGKSFNEGTDKFSGYGQKATGDQIGFKIYGLNNTFKDYARTGVTFSTYQNVSSGPSSSSTMAVSGSLVKKWVEPGKFFRESSLKKGTVIPMPDIKDKMPQRSFLPRTISSKLPFSSSKIKDLKETFHVADNSSMETMITETLQDCERAPSKGETKRCVSSAEDMIDFSTSVLGRSVVVRTTASVAGSKSDVMIGSVNGVNGGRVTKSVSCHQSLFPYLVYYCHSVPKVRVYEADILDPNSRAVINRGVAICHLDTTDWSPTHGAFLALGSKPGQIEVCHWIFENDLTWAVAD